MKKYLLLLTLAAVIMILSSCASQNKSSANTNAQVNDNTPPRQSGNLNTTASANINMQPDVTKDDLDKLKADINQMQFDNPNGLSK